MSTLKDVAALAQCSLTTASIVANGRGDEMHISPATQQRVAEAIQQLQYRPDRGAQLLRAGRRRLTIALYWPLDHHPADGGPAGRCPAAPPHPGAASCPLACGNGATGPASGILYPAGKCPCEQPVKMFHVKHLFAFGFSAPIFSHLASKHPPTGGCLLYCGLSSLRLTRTPTLLHRTQPALLSC